MQIVDYALIGDGTSDRALLPILSWSLRRLAPQIDFALQAFVHRGSCAIDATVDAVRSKYNPALIFVHRDAERLPLATRRAEVPRIDCVVPVIPVRMTEAWLLIDAEALRIASGNPNGRTAIELPRTRDIERLPDPKKDLERLLMDAAGALGQRRRKRFRQEQSFMVHRVAECIRDFSALHELEAFRAFWDELKAALSILSSMDGIPKLG